MSCGIGCRLGSDPVLLWLWHRLAATALISPLAWEPPYATGAALKKAKKTKKKKIYKLDQKTKPHHVLLLERHLNHKKRKS